MKKLFVIALAFVFTANIAVAQEGIKMLKEAKKEIGKYASNAVSNKANLDKALSLVDQAFKTDATLAASTAALTLKGDIYNEIGDAAFKAKVLKPDFKNPVAGSAAMAADAYMGAVSKVVKKGEAKDAIKALTGLEQGVFNGAIEAYQAQDLAGAFAGFNKAVEIGNVLKANATKSRMDDKVARDEALYFAAISGYQAGKKEEILPTLHALYKDNTDKSFVYQALYEIEGAKNDAAGEKYLNEGRKKFPEDSGLLFSEINYALKKGKLDELIGKLEAAIAKEPDNLTIYTTLGSVYEQLAAKDSTKAEANMKLAGEWYNKTLAKDPNNFEATYAIGAMNYNNAAKIAKEVNEYANDYSAAGTKKYNAAKDRMVKAFEASLPYFLKAETLNAKDLNTVIALKEIYARTGKMDKVKEYQEKYDKLNMK